MASGTRTDCAWPFAAGLDVDNATITVHLPYEELNALFSYDTVGSSFAYCWSGGAPATVKEDGSGGQTSLLS